MFVVQISSFWKHKKDKQGFALKLNNIRRLHYEFILTCARDIILRLSEMLNPNLLKTG